MSGNALFGKKEEEKKPILIDKKKRVVTVTEEAVKEYGADLVTLLGKAYEEIGNHPEMSGASCSLLLPSTVAVDPDILARTSYIGTLRVYQSGGQDVQFTRPLKEGEILRSSDGTPIRFSGCRKDGDLVIGPRVQRLPFTGTISTVDAGPGMKDRAYDMLNAKWRRDVRKGTRDTSVLIDNFRVEGKIDVEGYIDQLDKQELYRLARDINQFKNLSKLGDKKPLKDLSPDSPEQCRNAILAYANAKYDLTIPATKTKEEVREETMDRNREYIFRHLCLDSAYNGDRFGILAEDRRRRTVTLEGDVVSWRSLDRALEGDGYIKDNVRFHSASGAPQKVYLDMFEKQKMQEREERGKKSADDKEKKGPKLTVRSVEMDGDVVPVLGERQQEQLRDEIAGIEATLPGGKTLSEKEVQALADRKNAELFSGLEDLRTVSFDGKRVLEGLFRGNETLRDVHLGDNVEEVGDYAFKNSLVENVYGGRNVRRYGRMSFAQTTMEDGADLTFTAGKDNLRDFLQRPWREDSKRSGILRSSQNRNYKGIDFHDGDAFLNAERIEDGAFMNAALHVGQGTSPLTNQARFSERLERVGKFAFAGSELEGVSATTVNDHLRLDNHSFAVSSDLEYVSFGDSRNGRNGVDCASDSFLFAGGRHFREKDRGLRTEGDDMLKIDGKAKYERRAFAYANIKKVAVGIGAVAGIAKDTFLGCFAVRSITVPEGAVAMLIAPLQLAGIIGGLLYRKTLQPYVQRALAKWLRKDPDGFYGTVDKESRDLPDDERKETVEKTLALIGSESKDVVPAGGRDVAIGGDGDGLGPDDKALLADDPMVGRFMWGLFQRLYAKAMQRGLTVDDWLDTMGGKAPELEDKPPVTLAEYTEIHDELGAETKDPDNPQRTYPAEVFRHLQFKDGKAADAAPVLALPSSVEDAVIVEGDRVNTHINSCGEDGKAADVAVISTTPKEVEEAMERSDVGAGRMVTVAASEDEVRDFYKERTGVDITDPATPDEDLVKVCGKLGDIAEEDRKKYLDIAKRCSCEYLYKREAKLDTKGASEVYQSGVRQLFAMGMLDQIAGTDGVQAVMEHQKRNPDGILLKDGTMVGCSWNKVRDKDEFDFRVTTTRPVEVGMTKQELLRKYPFISEKSEALGRCHLYKSHPEYQDLLRKQTEGMAKPFVDGGGDSELKIRYDKKADRYSLFVVNKSLPTRLPTTMDAEQLTEFTRHMANGMVGCIAYGSPSLGVRPNGAWSRMFGKYKGMDREQVFGEMGITRGREAPSLGKGGKAKQSSLLPGLYDSLSPQQKKGFDSPSLGL